MANKKMPFSDRTAQRNSPAVQDGIQDGEREKVGEGVRVCMII